mgnify:CR=1 FL=1
MDNLKRIDAKKQKLRQIKNLVWGIIVFILFLILMVGYFIQGNLGLVFFLILLFIFTIIIVFIARWRFRCIKRLKY